MSDTPIIECWAVVSLMGHKRYAGRLTEESHFGTVLGRVDVPLDGERFQTVYFGGGSVYEITPCDEKVARAAAVRCTPAPVSGYDVKQLAADALGKTLFDGRDEDYDDERE